MNLKHLKDSELLSQTKQLVQSEREVLTQVLRHLREVDRRKLFSDLGYQSLFEYAVKDLQYSEGQAGRRIQAMRLIREIPELEKKIESGDLSLSNISQAQSYFRESQKAAPQMKINPSEKLKVLESLEKKSAREGQKVLISLQPQAALPRERERILDDFHTESSFVKTEKLSQQLEEVRSLLGPRGARLSLAELVGEMATISICELKIRRFGKKRFASEAKDQITQNGVALDHIQRDQASQGIVQPDFILQGSALFGEVTVSAQSKRNEKTSEEDGPHRIKADFTPTSELALSKHPGEAQKPNKLQGVDDRNKVARVRRSKLQPGKNARTISDGKESDLQASEKARSISEDKGSDLQASENPRYVSGGEGAKLQASKNPRYISRAIRYEVWNRDQGKCRICDSQWHLNFDHIKPIALGGPSTVENIRLLCSQCNQRQAIKIFGADRIQKGRVQRDRLPM